MGFQTLWKEGKESRFKTTRRTRGPGGFGMGGAIGTLAWKPRHCRSSRRNGLGPVKEGEAQYAVVHCTGYIKAWPPAGERACWEGVEHGEGVAASATRMVGTGKRKGWRGRGVLRTLTYRCREAKMVQLLGRSCLRCSELAGDFTPQCVPRDIGNT